MEEDQRIFHFPLRNTKPTRYVKCPSGVNISLSFLPEWKGKVLKDLSFREGFLGCIGLKNTASATFSSIKKNKRNNKDFSFIFGPNPLNYGSNSLNHENISCQNILIKNLYKNWQKDVSFCCLAWV